MRIALRTLAVAFIFLIGLDAVGQDAGSGSGQPSSTRDKDEQAIRSAAQSLAESFEAGDAKQLVGLFTSNAEYVDEGQEPIHGRDALAKAYSKLFENQKELKAEAKTESVRFLSSSTAVEEGAFTVSSKSSPPTTSRYSALYVREGDRWLVAMLKEWPDEGASQPQLDDLAWLIGTWEGGGPEATAKTTYAWTANKAFIRADYTITPKKEGEKPSTGTQVIGIDPAVGQIRAWLFASDGGIGESTWVREGNDWRIESVGTLADGTATSAINYLTPAGKNSFTWRSLSREHEGESQPDLPEVTVKRLASTEAPRAK